MKITIRRFLHELRVKKGFTLTQLGGLLGIDSGALSKIENERKQLDEKHLPRIAEIFQIDLADLRKEYLSEKIANEVLEYPDAESISILNLAEEKIKYLRSIKAKQSKLNI